MHTHAIPPESTDDSGDKQNWDTRRRLSAMHINERSCIAGVGRTQPCRETAAQGHQLLSLPTPPDRSGEFALYCLPAAQAIHAMAPRIVVTWPAIMIGLEWIN